MNIKFDELLIEIDNSLRKRRIKLVSIIRLKSSKFSYIHTVTKYPNNVMQW